MSFFGHLHKKKRKPESIVRVLAFFDIDFLPYSCSAVSAFFRQDGHAQGKDQKQHRIQPHGDFFRQKAGYRRHGGAAQIRNCHLGAHEGLG